MKHLSLSLKEKIGQLFMIGFKGTSLPDYLIKFIRTNHIGFVILFSRNIESIAQVIELNDTIHSLGKVPPLIYTDQEGGTIVRFNEMAATVVSAMGIAATGNPEYAETAGRLIGEDMHICGIDGVLAPVLDVNLEENNPVIGIRSFSDQPGVVVEYAEKFCQGLSGKKILACGKHYPGHGAARADSHLEIPVIPISQQDFTDYCFQPFETMAKQDIDSMMTAHILFPGISQDIATFSTYLIRELLREKAGYKGVVFTDCLEMKAVIEHFSPEDIVLKAINAGIDVMVSSHTFDFQEELLDILLFYTKKGTIEEKRIDESLTRILALKNKRFPGLTAATRPEQPKTTGIQIRKNIAAEREIADHAVTLLRNHLGILPMEKDKKTLVLEWTRSIKGPSVAENEEQSMIERISAQYLENREHLLLKPDEPLPGEMESQLKNYVYIIVFIYSRTGKIDYYQTGAVKKLLYHRKDAIIVSLENPYEIKKFSSVDTYLVTYGFRMVQVEALFKVLTGQIVPSGKLPVKIADLFDRGHGLNAFGDQEPFY
ncbi:MAG: beta-N-acetylhexosaminidase [Candidatus Aminicenantes bacterium]|nr:MAG: beta-N-acetylhexosaminidase [Candidatus Aminicenantes bacterium]